MSHEKFFVAGGTVLGYEHREKGINNQDGFSLAEDQDNLAAVVCDGCSEGAHSEAGAKIGAKLVSEILLRLARQHGGRIFLPGFWERVRLDTLAQLRIMANAMGGNLPRIVVDYFLFTVVGALVTKEQAVAFSIGDGLVALNGKIERLGPFPENEPPYLAYGLTGSSLTDTDPELLKFQLRWTAPAEEVRSILVGTDGALEFLQAPEKKLPGKDELLGPLSQFWEDEWYIRNADAVRRRLAVANCKVVRHDWKNQQVIKEIGLLPDDTTVVVIRRKD